MINDKELQITDITEINDRLYPEGEDKILTDWRNIFLPSTKDTVLFNLSVCFA